jgi:hypothetical protein
MELADAAIADVGGQRCMKHQFQGFRILLICRPNPVNCDLLYVHLAPVNGESSKAGRCLVHGSGPIHMNNTPHNEIDLPIFRLIDESAIGCSLDLRCCEHRTALFFVGARVAI